MTHTMPRAERRRVERNTPVGNGVGAAEETLASLIGQAVALRLAPILRDLQAQLGCVVCATDAKRAEREHEIAVANAQAAAEPPPDVPQIGVAQAFTIGPDGPVCWAHFEPASPELAVRFEPPVTGEQAREFARQLDRHLKSGE